MGWGTAQKFYSYSRKCQAYVEASLATNAAGSVTVKAKGYCRSGDGSGYYYAAGYTEACTLTYKVGSAAAVTMGTGTGTLNYDAAVGTIEKTSGSIAKAESAQTVTVTFSAANSAHPTATASVTLTIPALASYQVTFNANKPSGASGSVEGVPSAQTKYYGKALALAQNEPTLALHLFAGWNTKADGTGTAYAPGASYTGNAALALHARWEAAYAYPAIAGLSAIRSSSSGADSEEGTYAKVAFTWSVDATADSGANKGKSYKIETRPVGGSAWTSQKSANVSTASGTVSVVIGAASGASALAADQSYDVRVSVTDTHTVDGAACTSTAYVTLSQAFVYISANPQHGIAIGRTATRADTFEVGIDARFDVDVAVEGSVTAANLGRKVLYDGGSSYGTAGAVTLSESAAGFDHMLIFFGNGSGNVQSSVEVYKPDGRNANLFLGGTTEAGGVFWPLGRDVSISGRTISTRGSTRYYGATAATSTGYTLAKNNVVYITRVEAWNETYL